MLPLMIFLVLGVIQLAMLQHARLMTEYAAYNAVRAGIVWNGDQCMMRRAAVISILPTLGATDTLTGTSEPFGSDRPGLFQTWAMASVLVAGGDLAGGILDWIGIGGEAISDFLLVDIEILNPTEDDTQFFRDGPDGPEEMDFDVVAGVPGGPDFDSRPGMREANVLTVRVHFLYPMRIPFANWTIFYSFLAHRAGLGVSGSFFGPGLGSGGSIVTGSGVDTGASGHVAAVMGGPMEGLDGETVTRGWSLNVLWELGQRTGIYLFPLHAVHSMRMQSNFFRNSFDPPAFGECLF